MDLSRIDLNLLVTLDLLLAERDVAKAARRLALPEPEMWDRIARLRELMRDPLLVPFGRGMALTERALVLQTPLRQLLAQLGSLVTQYQPFDSATTRETFFIAATESAQAALCVPLIARLHAIAPGLRIEVQNPDPARLGEQLASGELDLALVPPQAMPPVLKRRDLYDERLVCLLRRAHPATARPLDLDAFCHLEHVVVSPDAENIAGCVDKALQKAGRSRRVAASVPSFLLAVQLVGQSDLVATVPARLAKQLGDRVAVQALQLEAGVLPLQMGWHPRAQSDPAQRWLRERVEELARADALS